MSAKKLVTVFGATGNQGGSILSAILNNPILSKEFTVRAITRDTNSNKAKDLQTKYPSDLTLATANLDDPASLKAALSGSYGVFAVTNFWEKMSKDIEVTQGRNVADACVATPGLKHVIWSSLPHVTSLTEGRFTEVRHFDGKAEVAQYFEQVKSKNSGMKVTYFQPGFYLTNMKRFIVKNEQTGNVPTLSVPWDYEKTWVSMFDPGADTGKFVAGILATQLQGNEDLDGKEIHAVSEWLTPKQILETIKEVSGTEVKYNQVPDEVYEGFLPKPVAADLGQMMAFIREVGYFGKGAEKKQEESNRVLQGLGLKTETWKEHVEQNGPWVW